jgi:hypothetical protein
MFRRLALGLAEPRTIYVDEYVGPSRFHWTTNRLVTAQAVLDEAPRAAKIAERILPPVEQGDPSEAYRSDEIGAFLRTFCDVAAWRPYGGQIVDLVFPYLVADWVNSEEGTRFVLAMLEREDEELARDLDATHDLVFYGRLKPAWRLARPLGRQMLDAVRRRLPRRAAGKP